MRSGNRSFIEEHRRVQLIACAIDVLAESGYRGASLAAIGTRAGVTPGVISYHFGSKDELLAAAVREIAHTAVTEISPSVTGHDTARAALRALIIANLDFLRQHRNYLVALAEIITNVRPADGSPGPYDDAEEKAVADVRRILDWGQRTGEFGAFDPTVMAVAVRAGIDALAQRLNAAPDLDIAHWSEELANTFDRATRGQRRRARAAAKPPAGQRKGSATQPHRATGRSAG